MFYFEQTTSYLRRAVKAAGTVHAFAKIFERHFCMFKHYVKSYHTFGSACNREALHPNSSPATCKNILGTNPRNLKEKVLSFGISNFHNFTKVKGCYWTFLLELREPITSSLFGWGKILDEFISLKSTKLESFIFVHCFLLQGSYEWDCIYFLFFQRVLVSTSIFNLRSRKNVSLIAPE